MMARIEGVICEVCGRDVTAIVGVDFGSGEAAGTLVWQHADGQTYRHIIVPVPGKAGIPTQPEPDGEVALRGEPIPGPAGHAGRVEVGEVFGDTRARVFCECGALGSVWLTADLAREKHARHVAEVEQAAALIAEARERAERYRAEHDILRLEGETRSDFDVVLTRRHGSERVSIDLGNRRVDIPATVLRVFADGDFPGVEGCGEYSLQDLCGDPKCGCGAAWMCDCGAQIADEDADDAQAFRAWQLHIGWRAMRAEPETGPA